MKRASPRYFRTAGTPKPHVSARRPPTAQLHLVLGRAERRRKVVPSTSPRRASQLTHRPRVAVWARTGPPVPAGGRAGEGHRGHRQGPRSPGRETAGLRLGGCLCAQDPAVGLLPPGRVSQPGLPVTGQAAVTAPASVGPGPVVRSWPGSWVLVPAKATAPAQLLHREEGEAGGRPGGVWTHD